MSTFVSASFASVSASLFPWIPMWALTQLNWIFYFVFPISINFLLISSMGNAWLLLFLSKSSVIWLSVYMAGVLSSVYRFSIYSSALTVASCSAWLLVHLLLNLYCRLVRCLPDLNMATPVPSQLIVPSNSSFHKCHIEYSVSGVTCIFSAAYIRGSFQKFCTLYVFSLNMNLFYKIPSQAFSVFSIVLYHSGPTFGQVLYSCQDVFLVDVSDYSGHLIRHFLNAAEAFPSEWFLQLWEQVKVWWAHVRTVRRVGKHLPSILFQNFRYCTWGMWPCVIVQKENTSGEHGGPFLANLWTQNILQKLCVVCPCYSGPRRHSVAVTPFLS